MDQEKTYKWIQDRLRELNAGTIAAADFHQLETMAKDDPFIADALEGYQLHPDLDHTGYLDSLTQKIKPYKRERRRWLIPNLTVTAVAASLILIVGFYAVMTRLATKPDEGLANATTSEHALSIEKSGDTVAIVPDEKNTIAAAEPSQPAAAAEVPRPESMRKSVTKPSSAKENKKEISASDATRSQPADENFDIEDTKTKGVSPPYGTESVQEKMDKQLAATAAAEEKQDAGYSANQMDPAVMAKRVNGRVIDVTNEGLIGAAIIVYGTNIITTTDLDGKFELYLPNTENEVTVSYTGYIDTSFTMKRGETDVLITLNEQLEDIPGALAQSVAPIKATPKLETMGFQNRNEVLFINYLKSNSKYPLADNLNSFAKTVALEFEVNADGHPAQIKVAQTSGDKKLDDEAVRLIKKGPDWQCEALTYPCKVKYSIYFRS